MPTKEELYEKGMGEMADGNLPGAIESLKAAADLAPEYAEALQALAMLHYQSGQFDEAIEAGKRLAKVTPNDILAHTSLSMFYVAKGMIPEAEAEANIARQLTWKQQLKESKKT